MSNLVYIDHIEAYPWVYIDISGPGELHTKKYHWNEVENFLRGNGDLVVYEQEMGGTKWDTLARNISLAEWLEHESTNTIELRLQEFINSREIEIKDQCGASNIGSENRL